MIAPEHLLLLRGRQSRVERQQLDVAAEPARQVIGGVADLPLAGEEHEHVTVRALREQLLDGFSDRLGLVTVA